MAARKTGTRSGGTKSRLPAKKTTTKRSANKQNGKVHTIGSYLIQRLQDYGITDLFGIPGDFVLQFYGMLEESPIRVIGTTREDNATPPTDMPACMAWAQSASPTVWGACRCVTR